MFRKLLFVGLICSASAGISQIAPLPSREIPEPVIEGGRLGKAYTPLIDELRKGGHVLLFRHERTAIIGDWDFLPFKAGECERQRNLSPVGRESARIVGEVIRTLEIPIAKVIASPYCRTMEHAQIAFGGVHQAEPRLIGPDGKERTAKQVRADVDTLVRTVPADSNLVLVGHHGTTDVFTTRTLDEGDVLVLKPDAKGQTKITAHMTSARWDEILRDRRRAAFEQRNPK